MVCTFHVKSIGDTIVISGNGSPLMVNNIYKKITIIFETYGMHSLQMSVKKKDFKQVKYNNYGILIKVSRSINFPLFIIIRQTDI